MTPTELPEMLRWIVYVTQAVGFPVAVAIWFMWKLNGKLNSLVVELRHNADAQEHATRVQEQQTLLLNAQKQSLDILVQLTSRYVGPIRGGTGRIVPETE